MAPPATPPPARRQPPTSRSGRGFAVDAKNEAKQHAQALEQLVPDPHAAIVAELATHEQSGLLNIGPKRNRWSELQAFDEQLVEIERRREELGREIGELIANEHNEPPVSPWSSTRG